MKPTPAPITAPAGRGGSRVRPGRGVEAAVLTTTLTNSEAKVPSGRYRVEPGRKASMAMKWVAQTPEPAAIPSVRPTGLVFRLRRAGAGVSRMAVSAAVAQTRAATSTMRQSCSTPGSSPLSACRAPQARQIERLWLKFSNFAAEPRGSAHTLSASAFQRRGDDADELRRHHDDSDDTPEKTTLTRATTVHRLRLHVRRPRMAFTAPRRLLGPGGGAWRLGGAGGLADGGGGSAARRMSSSRRPERPGGCAPGAEAVAG